MKIQFFNLTKPKDGFSVDRYYFGLLPYFNVTWSAFDTMIFAGLWQFAMVITIERK